MITTRRLPRIVLAILGVWGLLAGAMLIRTLVATNQLHRRVTAITTSVSEIDRDTDSIALMQETNRISARLLAASEPLPEILEAMRGVTNGLAGKVDSILAGTTTIERDSREIEGKVITARSTAGEIHGAVRSIRTHLESILATLRSTRAAAEQINGSTRGIDGAVAALLPVTREIDAGIGTANRGVITASGIVAALAADVTDILALVPDLAEHARSVDCSSGLALLHPLLGPGESCTP